MDRATCSQTASVVAAAVTYGAALRPFPHHALAAADECRQRLPTHAERTDHVEIRWRCERGRAAWARAEQLAVGLRDPALAARAQLPIHAPLAPPARAIFHDEERSILHPPLRCYARAVHRLNCGQRARRCHVGKLRLRPLRAQSNARRAGRATTTRTAAHAPADGLGATTTSTCAAAASGGGAAANIRRGSARVIGWRRRDTGFWTWG